MRFRRSTQCVIVASGCLMQHVGNTRLWARNPPPEYGMGGGTALARESDAS
ncbi:hypothetical protein [Pandoraea faecigallinarum]|uniref:hypothetical protein n=1 Tax=Pandoraea faecigallinarum TaxID=656179 RepID=UPI0012F48058|nr:hypothetical protein [Pandoraea faecigallinarum]